MNSTECPSAMDFAGYGIQATLLEVLPKLQSLPGGNLYGNYLAWKAAGIIRRGTFDLKERAGHLLAASISVEDRQELAAKALEVSENLRGLLEQVLPFKGIGPVRNLLIDRFEAAVIDYCDLTETIALAADPEMAALGKELDSVL